MAFVPYWMNPARAKEAIEAGQAIVLDVTSQFIEGAVRGKIPGAVWNFSQDGKPLSAPASSGTGADIPAPTPRTDQGRPEPGAGTTAPGQGR